MKKRTKRNRYEDSIMETITAALWVIAGISISALVILKWFTE